MGDPGRREPGLWAGRPKLVLASVSPRRRELLERLGALAEVRPPAAAEDPGEAGDPIGRAVDLSRRKAESVARSLSGGVVLGSDTVVVVDGELLGKPSSVEEARAMLRRLSGRAHEVVTGITLIAVASGRRVSRHARTRVRFRRISEAEIEAYLATGEPFDKAGGYAAQGSGGFFIESVDGCFYNVVGLPLAVLVEALDDLVRAPAAGHSGRR